jgi:hypothetical protein
VPQIGLFRAREKVDIGKKEESSSYFWGREEILSRDHTREDFEKGER